MMRIRKLKDGRLKVHMEDIDAYDVTDDNGVDIWFSPEQIKRLAKAVG
jgi:hypothetical protein